MTTLLKASDLESGYGNTVVVRKINLDVHSGEVVALLGPNGAGKSTTLLTFSGLLPVRSGSVTVLGEDIATKHGVRAHKLARCGLGHVPEDRGLFRNLTVEQHLRLANADSGIEDNVLERLPALMGLLDRRAGLLSGGEQQMLAMARALVAQPKLLMLDEMSLGLAPQIVTELLHVVRELAEDGVGILLVEQHVRLALATADRAYVLRRGEIVLSGSAQSLIDDPDALEVAYLGHEAKGVA